jgi:hypothetical protein
MRDSAAVEFVKKSFYGRVAKAIRCFPHIPIFVAPKWPIQS